MQICYKSLLCPQPSLLIMSKSSRWYHPSHIGKCWKTFVQLLLSLHEFKLDQEKYKLPRWLDNSQGTNGIFKLHATILPHAFSHILTGTYIRHFCCATIESRHPLFLFYFILWYGTYSTSIRFSHSMYKWTFQVVFLVIFLSCCLMVQF